MWTKGSRTCHMVRINLFGGSGLQNIMNPHYDVGSVLVGTMTPHKKTHCPLCAGGMRRAFFSWKHCCRRLVYFIIDDSCCLMCDGDGSILCDEGRSKAGGHLWRVQKARRTTRGRPPHCGRKHCPVVSDDKDLTLGLTPRPYLTRSISRKKSRKT